MNASLVLAIGTVLQAALAAGTPRLHVDDGRLVRASWEDGSCVLFAKNGYMVLRRKGMCLADCGLYYQSPEFRRWGYQLRRVDQRGTAEANVKNGRVQFSDVLYEQVNSPDTRLEFRELLRYTQLVMVEHHGLLVRYEVLPTQPLAAGLLGAYLHLPVRLYAGALVRLFPGFASASLPKPVSRKWTPKYRTRRVVVAEGTDREVQVMLPDTWQWIGADQRPFRLNTYRLQFAVPLSRDGLRPGKPVSFEFRLLTVGPQPRPSVAMDGAALQVTPGGCFELRCGAKPLAQIGPLLRDPSSGRTRSALMESFAAMPSSEAGTVASGHLAGDTDAPSWSMSAKPLKEVTPPDGQPRSENDKGQLCNEIAIDTACSADRGDTVGVQVLVDRSELAKFETEERQAGGKGVTGKARVLLANAHPRGVRLNIKPGSTPVQKRKMADQGAEELVFPLSAEATEPAPNCRGRMVLSAKLGKYVPVTPTQRPKLPELERISSSSPDAIGVLPDDRETRGDWIGRYGSYAYILCGMGGEHTFSGGSGWDRVPYAYYSGSKDDAARAWMSWCQTDDRVLQNPTEFGLVDGVLRRVRYDSIPDGAALPRLPAVWDDHGETYDKSGPNLYVDLTIPPGLHVFSLYFFEIDWIQHRNYRLNLRRRTWAIGKNEERQLGSMLAWTTVSNLFQGVYKRFLVRGPQDLQVEIGRLDSPNAVLSGVFIDPVVPVYELSHPFAYAANQEIRGLHAARMPALVQAAQLLDKPPAEILSTPKQHPIAVPDGADPTTQAFTRYLNYVAALHRPGRTQLVLDALRDYCASLHAAFGRQAALDELEAIMQFFLRHRDGRQAAVACHQYLDLINSADANVPEETDRLLRVVSAFWADKGRRVASRDRTPRDAGRQHDKLLRFATDLQRSNEQFTGNPHHILRRTVPRYDCGYRVLVALLARAGRGQAATARLIQAARDAFASRRFRLCRMIYEALTGDRHAAEVLPPRSRYEWGFANLNEPGPPRRRTALSIWEQLMAGDDLKDVALDELCLHLGTTQKSFGKHEQALATYGRLILECPQSRWFGTGLSHIRELALAPEHYDRARGILERALKADLDDSRAKLVSQALKALGKRPEGVQ